jgi:integrase/recombinase XerD
MEDFYLMTYRN